MVESENRRFPKELSVGVGILEWETASGLPPQFVKSMRTLFDMMDDNGIGKVALSEIERRWRDDAVPNLPGVLDALRTVAPPKGLLTFEDFVSGLGLALRRTRLKNHQRGCGTAKHNFGFQPQPNYSHSVDPGIVNRQPSNLCHRHLQKFRSRDVQTTRNVYCRAISECAKQSDFNYNRSRFKHRRSNSGPICIGKSFADSNEPTQPDGIISADDSFVESRIKPARSTRELPFVTNVSREAQAKLHNAHQYVNNHSTKVLSDATNIGARSSPSGCDSPAPDSAFQSLSQESISSPITNDNHIDRKDRSNMLNDRILGNDENSHVISVKPVVVSGKYIGITGTLQKTKSMASSACKQYGSLPRRTAAKSIMASMSYPELPRRGSAENRKEDSSSDHSKFEFFDTHPHKRSVPKRTDGIVTRFRQEESYARNICNTSPQDVRVEKSARKVATSNCVSPKTQGSACSSDSTAATRRRRNSSQTPRRRGGRWNTTGATFNNILLKRLKTIQQKEDLLRKGMATADGIRTVFLRALMGVEDEKSQLEKEVDPFAVGLQSDVNQSKTQESAVANSVIAAMSDLEHVVSEFQLLQMSAKNVASNTDSGIQSLTAIQEQNLRLSKEVSEKCDVIQQLEQEKAALVRQLFQARSELRLCDGNQGNTSIFI